MAMTPDEVETKEFVRVMRGYDPAEVASFLRVVAAEMRKRDQVAEAIEASASGPLANEVVAVLRTAYETAHAQARTAPARPARPARPQVTRRQRPLRVAS
jgi:DivIVA domain-containing protein